MVQFAQSHTVDPSGNEAKEMPRLTTSREAMVLITPDPSLGEITQMQVSVSVNGVSKGILQLRHPNEIFRSDYAATDGRADYVYTRRAWTAVLPWDWVAPGLELRVADNQNRSGVLQRTAIEFGAPAELVVQSIRLGMLTPPEVNDNRHWFRGHPAQAATDYFQTIPAARMVASYYEDVTLSRVMVATGTIYDKESAVTGDVYSGDMRENTAKSTFSVGINLANFGVTSAGMQSQEQPQVFQTAVIHHARGKYSNGVVEHGLSGGNGILTLGTSQGNEFSHEIGHHYGIGHYPGQNGTDFFWSAHHQDSGWGFIAYRKRMRSSLLWHRGTNCELNGTPVLDGIYCFAPDAMSGGDFSSSLSKYTHYTGFSTKRWIQPSLNRNVLDPKSPTGYQKWNANMSAMEAVQPAMPTGNSNVWYNSANGKFLAPRLQGVPVITLLGGYDPVDNKALMYPALRGNWGNVYDLPAQSFKAASETTQCWIDVTYANNARTRIALAGKRMQTGLVNKFHINLAQSEQPKQASLSCLSNGVTQQLGQVDIPVGLPAMPAPVVVGKDARFDALRAEELPTLDAALTKLAGKKVLALTAAERVLYDSYADNTDGLSTGAKLQLNHYNAQQEQGMRLNRWINAYSQSLDQQVPEAEAALRSFIAQLGLGSTPLIPAAQSMTMANGNCLQKVGGDVRVAGKTLCTAGRNEQWILDGRGAIRSREDLSLCMTYQGASAEVKLLACDVRNDNQVWDTSVAKRIARGNQCLDLSSGFLTNNVGKLITYSCTGGGNQQWAGLLQSTSLLLPLLASENARYLEALDKNDARLRR